MSTFGDLTKLASQDLRSSTSPRWVEEKGRQTPWYTTSPQAQSRSASARMQFGKAKCKGSERRKSMYGFA